MIPTTDATTFQSDVIDGSRRRPVVVDFWADWCGPCHQLSPILERVAQRHDGAVDVRKLDVDANPELARTYRVQGIPAVKAFKDGAVVAEFTGVQPEQSVEQFFAALAPSPADRLTARAGEAGDAAAAEALLREALEVEPGHEHASVALARMLVERGAFEEARSILDKAPDSAEVRQLRSRCNLAEVAAGDLDDLRALAADGDVHARVRLGRALAGAGSYEEALDTLLAVVPDPSGREDARQAVLEIYDLLGGDDDLVRRTRPRLASALYA